MDCLISSLTSYHRIHFLFILFLHCSHFTSMVSSHYMALMDAESEGGQHGTQSHTLCINYEPKFSSIPSSAEEASLVPLVDLSNKLGCSSSDFSHAGRNVSISGTAVAVSRGDCTFSKKADLAQSLNATSVLIIDYKNSTSLPIPVANHSSDYDLINITVASVAWADYQDVIALPPPVGVKIYAIKSSKFDPNMIVILFGSTLITVIGALWTAHSEKNKNSSRSCRSQGSDVEQNNSSSSRNASSSNQTMEITPTLILFWVVFLVAIILLLYFFYDYAVFFFIVIFCLAGSHGLYNCLLPLWSRLVPFHYHIPQRFIKPFTKEKMRLTSLGLYLLCLTVGIFWAVQRHESYAWIFQDILGVAFSIWMLHTLRLPSLKIITMIMVLLFCYDVFFVFITPLFTKDGESIMVDVATGGKGHHREMVPLVFIIPLLNYHPATVCTGRAFSILGFGDVILPGLLIVFTAVFDIYAKSKMAYLITSSLGYLVGMAGCLVALVFMESGQPALFYLVPATLIPTYALAFKRGELREMWAGKRVNVADSKRSDADNGNANTSVNSDSPTNNYMESSGEESGNEDRYEGVDEDGEQSPLMN